VGEGITSEKAKNQKDRQIDQDYQQAGSSTPERSTSKEQHSPLQRARAASFFFGGDTEPQ
jgi:hypothetical protein